MRNQIVAGNCFVQYPDEVVFLNDRNVISLKSLSATYKAVGGTFSLTDGMDTIQISYMSERDNLVFDLYSVLKKLYADGSQTISVSGSVVIGDTTANIVPFTLQVNEGRTLENHPHCAERIVYFYDQSQLYGFEILTLNGGTVNGVSVNAGISKHNFNRYSDFTVTVVDGNETREIKFKYSNIGGFASSGCRGIDSSNGYITIKYKNTDGCTRFLCGKIKSRKRSIGQTEWRDNSLVRNTPNSILTECTDEITVVFPECERLAYVEDIMFSSSVEYVNDSGDWKPAIITSKSLTLNNWDQNDIEITLKTLA